MKMMPKNDATWILFGWLAAHTTLVWYAPAYMCIVSLVLYLAVIIAHTFTEESR